MLRSEIAALERQIDGLNREKREKESNLEDLQRERDILNKNYLKAQGETVCVP